MFHFRFTPYDISGYTFDFLDSIAHKYILSWEDKDKTGKTVPKHYHCYIETTYGEKSVRDAIKSSLKIPASGRGKNNKYYAFQAEWKDPGYVCKYDNIVKSKGFTEKQILECVISGKKKYLDKVDRGELSGDRVAPAPKSPKVPFQQAVIAYAAAEWYKYKATCKESGDFVSELEVVEFVCKGMREHGRGINQYLVKELAYAVLYDDLDYRETVMKKIRSFFLG